MKKYSVNFRAHHIIEVEADDEEKAIEEAQQIFEGFVDFETEVEEIKE